MSISQIFILSMRGDTIIKKDFRRELQKGTNEIFFRKVNLDAQSEEVPPIFNIDGINYIHVKKQNLYFVLTSLDNVSPHFFFEILERIIKVISDQIGDVSEEAIRKNFVLIYEILDELIDCGIPQLSNTEEVKQFVFTEPIVMIKPKTLNTIQELFSKNLKSQEHANRPIYLQDKKKDSKDQKNEIYVDILEKITVLFNSSGKLINSDVDGCIKMKSFLKGCPELTIVLNDEIAIGKGECNYGRTSIEDCNFYHSVQTRDLESKRTLHLIPPEGEFILMNYRISNEFTPPFKFYITVEENDYKLTLRIKLQANFSDKFFGGNIIVKFNIPKSSQSVYTELPIKNKSVQKVDYIQSEHTVMWKVPKLQGGSEASLNTKITLQNNNPKECRNELGPITMSFDLPHFNISKLQIKDLKVNTNDKKYNAARWVRVITKSNSYVARIG